VFGPFLRFLENPATKTALETLMLMFWRTLRINGHPAELARALIREFDEGLKELKDILER